MGVGCSVLAVECSEGPAEGRVRAEECPFSTLCAKPLPQISSAALPFYPGGILEDQQRDGDFNLHTSGRGGLEKKDIVKNGYDASISHQKDLRSRVVGNHHISRIVLVEVHTKRLGGCPVS